MSCPCLSDIDEFIISELTGDEDKADDDDDDDDEENEIEDEDGEEELDINDTVYLVRLRSSMVFSPILFF